MKTGTCPICNGTGRVSAAGTPHATVYAGYDPADNTLTCHNCGGQTMSGVATGVVPLRPDGTPCAHSYAGVEVGHCYRRYTCRHCGDSFSIDSGG